MEKITFTLNETESQRAGDFMAAHKHKEEFEKLVQEERELTEAFLAQSRKSMSEVITRNA